MRNERIYLRMIEEADIKQLARFFTDPDAMKYYIPTLWRSYSEEQLKGLLEDWHDQSAYFLYVICSCEDDRVIGLANLDGVNYVNGNTEIGIAISAADMRGQGIAEDALKLLIRYCFDELRLHRVFARVISENVPSLGLFRKLGFREEGRFREHVRREGTFLDLIFFGLLSAEWADAG